jgi:hypothetical protein
VDSLEGQRAVKREQDLEGLGKASTSETSGRNEEEGEEEDEEDEDEEDEGCCC